MDERNQDDLPLSRTKKKQQAKQVEQLAEQLVGLADSQFAQLDLPDPVVREAELARTTRGRSSQRRQLKHLAGILRKMDDLERVEAQLGVIDQVARTEKRQFHQLETLRDRLCRQETFDAAFEEMLDLVPGIDRKAISRLARSVHQHEDKRAYREIFKRLRDALE
jgi:ribosome-associated protein